MNALEEIICNETPIEERADWFGKSPVPVDEKLATIASAGINFYEKVYFSIDLLGGKLGKQPSETREFVLHEIFPSMSIGQIVTEILKPTIVAYTPFQVNYSHVFNDQRQKFVEEFQNRLLDPTSELHAYWCELQTAAEHKIEEIYVEGLEHFVQVIREMDSRQPFIQGPQTLAFVSENEFDYLLKLYQWTKGKGFIGAHHFGEQYNELQQFMADAERQDSWKGKVLRPFHDSKVDKLKKNTVTILGYQIGNSESTPYLMTLRAKTLNKSRRKLSEAISAILAFYEGPAYRIFDDMYGNLERTISDRIVQDRTSGYLERAKYEVDAQVGIDPTILISRNDRDKAWKALSQDEKRAIWNNMAQDVRSEIVKSFAQYGRLISKYNVWQDVVGSLDDLFGITLAFSSDSAIFGDIDTVVINRLYNPTERQTIVAAPGTQTDTKQSGYYRAKHIDIVHRDARSATSSRIQPIETHITTLIRIALTETVGAGQHVLYKERNTADLCKQHPLISDVLERVGRVIYDKENNKSTGLLMALKSKFPYFMRMMEEQELYRRNI